MFVEGGWKRPDEPVPRPRLTGREERWLLWVIGLFVATMFIAPIGGATILQALIAVVVHRG